MGNFSAPSSVINFYNKAEVQDISKFVAIFTDEINDEKETLYKKIGNMPLIHPWQIKSIEYPYGPAIENKPVFMQNILTVSSYSEFKEATISFVENKNNNILAFQEWCFRKIVDENGMHRPIPSSSISYLDIYEFDEYGDITNHERLKDLTISTLSRNLRNYEGHEIIYRDLAFKYEDRLREDLDPSTPTNYEEVLKDYI